MSSPSHKYIEVKDLTLHMKEWSTSGRLLLLMHSGLHSCDAWDEIAPRFRDHYHGVAVDLRGHNLSFGPAAGYSWTDDMAEDIVQLLPQLTAEPAVLIVHSLGAMVAIPASIKAPDAVAAIVLEDPPTTHTKSDHASDSWQRNLDFYRLSLDEKTEFLLQQGMPLHEARPKAEKRHRNSPAILEEMIAGKAWYDYREWLPKIDCNTFALFGENGVVHPDDQRHLAESYDFTRVSQWEGAGHGLHKEEDPERFVREVTAFLDDYDL